MGIFETIEQHEMPGHLDSDLYCQQWVRLSMLWENRVSDFHIILNIPPLETFAIQ